MKNKILKILMTFSLGTFLFSGTLEPTISLRSFVRILNFKVIPYIFNNNKAVESVDNWKKPFI